MYSKVKIAGHPLHPMLIAFPVTLYTATVVGFVAYAFGAPLVWYRIGLYSNLAAVIAAAIAAVPGFIDWAFGIPSGTPAKATGRMHMTLNVVSLLLFALNLALQWRHRFDLQPAVGSSVLLPLLGIVATITAGFLGWKLVQTHHVGIDLTPEQRRFEPAPGVDTGSRDIPRGTGHPAH